MAVRSYLTMRRDMPLLLQLWEIYQTVSNSIGKENQERT